MAVRYWVGGSGTWDTTSTTNWSATSGGAGGASAPTSADSVVINASSGAGTITLGENVTVITVNTTGYTGTLNFANYKISLVGTAITVFTGATTATYTGNPTIELSAAASTGTRQVTCTSFTEANSINLLVTAGTDTVNPLGNYRDIDLTGFTGSLTNQQRTYFGNVTFPVGPTYIAGTSVQIMGATSGTKVLKTFGQLLDFGFVFNGVGGTFQLFDDLQLGTTRTLTFTNGTLDANNKNVTTGSVQTNNANTRTLKMGSGTWTLTGANWNATNATGLTVEGTATVNMASASAKTFNGGGANYGTITLNQGGAGALTINASNTFANITNTVQPATITFQASTTNTVGAFTVSGTSGNLITINSSTPGTQATLSDASGVNSVSFCDIKDINATGGATWDAYYANGNVDSGNNTNWNFGGTPVVATEVTYRFRSFTTPRRF